ncbi:uncharacterized protein LOC141789418 [Halichoeres trimaculatus]|uniref:uncharacterized protein LOC141789418 n=1 Tax=Halichoeres trimaculatus TaxID=147232 RepID=UPI003D9F9B0B
MKLTLCVPLIWMLFSSAEALKCVQEELMSGMETSTEPQPCSSPDVHCATIAYQYFTLTPPDYYFITRTCLPTSLCNEGNQSFSLSYYKARMSASFQCCSTDGCNKKDVSFLDEQEPNGLQCVTRYPRPQSDLKELQCVGIDDRCIVLNGTEYGITRPFYGCASANLCEDQTNMKLLGFLFKSVLGDPGLLSALECCNTTLCNSAPSDKLSVIPLLLGLVALSVH